MNRIQIFFSQIFGVGNVIFKDRYLELFRIFIIEEIPSIIQIITFFAFLNFLTKSLVFNLIFCILIIILLYLYLLGRMHRFLAGQIENSTSEFNCSICGKMDLKQTLHKWNYFAFFFSVVISIIMTIFAVFYSCKI